MPLTLITGRANSGKTGELHAAIRAALTEGKRTALLLPTIPDVERAAKEFRSEQIIGLSITTLDSWIADTWALFGDGRRLVGDTVRPTLLRHSLHVPDESRLAAAMSTPGFLDLLADLAKQTRATARQEVSEQETREISRALDDYRNLLTKYGYIELIDVVAVLSVAPLAIADLVVANRFTDLSAIQEEFLSYTSAVADVRLALPWEEGFPATEALDSLVDRISALGRVQHVPARPARTELERLEETLYRSSPEPLVSEGSVLLAEAAGGEAEVALAVRIVAEEIASGRSPDRIAIVFRDVAHRRDSIVAALRQANVPAYTDVSRCFRDTEYGSALLALLEQCGRSDPERVSLLGFLLSPYSFANPDVVQALDARWRKNRVQGCQLIAQAVREFGPSTGRMFDLASRLMAASHVYGLEADWQELAGLAFAAGEERLRLDDSRLRRDAAAHRSFCRVVSDVCDVPNLPIAPSDMLVALRNAYVHEAALEMMGAVHVTEAHRLRARRFDVVVVGGLTAAEFSSDKPQSLVSVLAAELGVRHNGDDRLRERLLFYSVASRAKGRLVLLRQVVGPEGQDKRPSIFWDEVVDLYRGPEGIATALPVERLTLLDVGVAAPGYASGRVSARQHGVLQEPVKDVLEDEEILSSLAELEEFSVTELETYLACPRRWFHEKVIGRGVLDRTFDAREAGGLAHRALALFYELLPGVLGADRVTIPLLEPALELADRALAEAEQVSVETYGLLEELSLARVRKRVRTAIQQDAHLFAGMVPVVHELSFGDEAGVPVDIGGVRIRGRLDRVDRSASGVFVTDYKTGPVRGWGSFATYGLVQVPAYAFVAGLVYEADVFGGVYRSLTTGLLRGFWRPDLLDLRDVGSSADAIGHEAVEELIDEALAKVRNAAECIRSGSIEAVPGSSCACSFCGLKTSCKAAR